MIYALACCVYFTMHQNRVKQLFTVDEMDPLHFVEETSKMLVYALSLYMLAFEILQIQDFGKDYFLSFTNWVDQISTFFIIGIMIKNDFFPDKIYSIGYESIMATFAIALTWYKMFYWMKLFESTAFFINLLYSTFIDKNFTAFMIMTAFLLACFTNILYVLNTERGDELRY